MRQLVVFDEPPRVNESWLGFSKPQLLFISPRCNTDRHPSIAGISYLNDAWGTGPNRAHEISWTNCHGKSLMR